MEKKNFVFETINIENEVANFVAKLQSNVERVATDEKNVFHGENRKETAQALADVQRGYFATAKIICNYVKSSPKAEKECKKSFYNFFSLKSIHGLKAEDLKAFLKENLSGRFDSEGRLVACVKSTLLEKLRKELKAARDEFLKLSGAAAPEFFTAEIEAAKNRVKELNKSREIAEKITTNPDGDKATKSEYAEKLKEISSELETLEKFLTASKDWKTVLLSRIEAQQKQINEAANAIENAAIAAGFASWTDENGTYLGSYAPMVQFTPQSLAKLIKLAAANIN